MHLVIQNEAYVQGQFFWKIKCAYILEQFILKCGYILGGKGLVFSDFGDKSL